MGTRKTISYSLNLKGEIKFKTMKEITASELLAGDFIINVGKVLDIVEWAAFRAVKVEAHGIDGTQVAYYKPNVPLFVRR